MLDFPTAGTSRLAAQVTGARCLAAVTRWFQSTLDRFDRPLAVLVVELFLLALRRAER